MALAALPSASGVGSLCLRKRLHHYRAPRLARSSYWKPICLSLPRPTAYLFFFSPLAEVSSPRNAILGHAIGLICGYSAFALAVASSPPFGINPGVHGARLLAAALSLSATGALMALLRISHPPAGATTLIVSLGIISQPKELVIIEVAVILLTMQAFVINRLAGIPYPFWSEHDTGEIAH
jgi:CBS domain-containing membrane protein